MAHVEILGGCERRRRWSESEMRRIVEESFGPGCRVVDAVRRNKVAASLVFAWRRQAREGLRAMPPLFVPVAIADAAQSLVSAACTGEPERSRRGGGNSR